MKLNERQRDFLKRVRDDKPLRLADREEDRVRQGLRRRGLVVFDRPNWRWLLTDAGRQALNPTG